MSGRLRCPKCGEAVAGAGPGRPAACPACGAKFAWKQQPARPARGADNASGPPPEPRKQQPARPDRGADDAGGPPVGARKRKRDKKPSARPVPVLLWAIPAGVLGLLAVVALGVWLFWHTGARPKPGPAPGVGGDDAADVADAGEPPPPPVANFPAVPWTVPPGGLPSGPRVADVIDLLDVGGARQPVFLFPGCRDRYLTAVTRPDPMGMAVEIMAFGRFDPATGKPVGAPVVLGVEYQTYETTAGPADVAPDGTLAAMSIRAKTADTAAAINVLTPGSQEPRRLPPAVSYPKWFGWSAANRLLVLKDGKLIAWDPAADKPAFEVGEKLVEPVALSPARNWLVVSVDGQYLEVRDTATGEVRGRFGGEGDWKFLDISADGKRLAGIRYMPLMPGTVANHPYDAELHAWDLATGERTARFKETKPGPVTWAGPDHLFHDGRVFELESGLPVISVTRPAAPNGITQIPSPDGRSWWSARNGEAFAAEIPTKPAGGKVAFSKGNPVRLEVSCSDGRRVEPAKAALTKQLTAGGHPVGDSQWLVKVKAEEYDTGRTLVVTGQGKAVQQPGVKGEMKLIAPDGTAVLTVPIEYGFRERRSKYFVRERRDETQVGFILEYDFKGADPRKAILDEVWGQFVRYPADVKGLPAVWEVGGKYQPLPLPIPLTLPAAVRTSLFGR